MRLAVPVVALYLYHLSAAGASAQAMPGIITDEPAECLALRRNLTTRQAELDTQRAALESGSERDEINRILAVMQATLETIPGDQRAQAGLAADFNTAVAALTARSIELDKLIQQRKTTRDLVTAALLGAEIITKTASLNKDVAQSLELQQKLPGSRRSVEERLRASNDEVSAAQESITLFNQRIEAYNELSRRFEREITHYKVTCPR